MNERSESPTFHYTGDTIIKHLERRGFVPLTQSNDGAHVLLRRDHIDIVVPGAERAVPDKVAQMIEQSLESALGPDWLRAEPSTNDAASPSDDVVMLDVVVLEPMEDELWRAFLVDDLSTIGYSDTRRGALADLKAAAALRIGVTPEHLVLVTPDVI